MDSDGDPAVVKALLDGESMDSQAQFGQVVGLSTLFFFSRSWPALLRLFEENGVSRERVRKAVYDDITELYADWLRKDVQAP